MLNALCIQFATWTVHVLADVSDSDQDVSVSSVVSVQDVSVSSVVFVLSSILSSVKFCI